MRYKFLGAIVPLLLVTMAVPIREVRADGNAAQCEPEPGNCTVIDVNGKKSAVLSFESNLIFGVVTNHDNCRLAQAPNGATSLIGIVSIERTANMSATYVDFFTRPVIYTVANLIAVMDNPPASSGFTSIEDTTSSGTTLHTVSTEATSADGIKKATWSQNTVLNSQAALGAVVPGFVMTEGTVEVQNSQGQGGVISSSYNVETAIEATSTQNPAGIILLSELYAAKYGSDGAITSEEVKYFKTTFVVNAGGGVEQVSRQGIKAAPLPCDPQTQQQCP